MAETFAQVLQRFRTRRGLTKADLAEALGAGRSSIVAWEAGRRVPRDRARLLDIAQVLGLTTEETDHLVAAARGREHHEDTVASIPQATPAVPVPIPALPHHLRPAVADFVGRAEAIAQLIAALQVAQTEGNGAAIVGVRGMGGIGKTELAYHLADRVRDAFPDAQVVLELRGSSPAPLTPAQAGQAVIHAFTPDARLPDDLPALEQHYRTALHGRRVLILADDASDAAQVRPLLPPRGCALLITSRQRFTLPGMLAVDLRQLGDTEAVTLLRGVCARLAAEEAQAIARVCGGLPLALRISGSILHNDPALSVATYLRQVMDERLRLSQLRDPDDPHLDVEASLALSYVQLDAAAQAVFRQLGVLAADFTAELALAVVERPPDADVAATLHRLLRRNLVIYDTEQGRWRLHDLVRDLARRELEARGEAEATRWRYARAAVRLAQATQAQYLAGGEGVLAVLARFDAERPHIDAGHDWAAAQPGTPDGDRLLLDIVLATIDIGELRYDVRRERIPQWERALVAAQRLGEHFVEGRALNNLGLTYFELGEIRRAIPYYQQRLTIARSLGDRGDEGGALGNLGNAYIELGEVRHAIPYLEQYLTIARAIADRRGAAIALSNLGNAYAELGDSRCALPYYRQALISFRELGARRSEGITLSNLGRAYIEAGDAKRGIAPLKQAIAIARELSDRRSEAIALGNLGRAYTEMGDEERAIEASEESLVITRDIGDRRSEGYALSALACVRSRQGGTATYEQAVAILREVGDRWGEAECNWQFGLALVLQGAREQALPLLRAALAYKQEIGHARVAEHAALLARLEAGEELPVVLRAQHLRAGTA